MKRKTEEGRNDGTKKTEIKEPHAKHTEDSAPAEQDKQELRTALEEKEKEAKENYEKYLRSVAELENYKKYAARERSDLIKYNNEKIIRDILPILDGLDRALEHAGTANDVKAFANGIRMIQEQFLAVLEKYGVQRIESVGREFDPNIHEALLQVESDEYEDKSVVAEFEKGYLLNDRLLKPAKVSVSKRPSGEKEREQGND